MPLEINEIGISMRVSGSGADGAPVQVAGLEGLSAEDREEWIDECVRRVLKALRNLGEP